MAGTFTITGEDTSAAGTWAFGPSTVTGQSSSGAETLQVVLSSGDNTITIPAGMTAAFYITPTTTATLKLRTSLNNTDGGLPLASGQPGVYVFPNPAPTSLIVNASTGQTAPLTVAFI